MAARPLTARTAPSTLALLLGVVAIASTAAGCDPERGGDESQGSGGAVTSSSPSPGGAPSARKATFEKIKIKDRTYSLEVASDDAARSKGMGGRTSMPDDGGMLFVFPDSQRRGFWMRDCTLDLDIIFVDPLGYVTAVHTMPAEPPRRADETESAYLARLKNYSSISPAQFAIELRAGEAERLGIKPNQKIDAEWKRIAKLAR